MSDERNGRKGMPREGGVKEQEPGPRRLRSSCSLQPVRATRRQVRWPEARREKDTTGGVVQAKTAYPVGQFDRGASRVTIACPGEGEGSEEGLEEPPAWLTLSSPRSLAQ